MSCDKPFTNGEVSHAHSNHIKSLQWRHNGLDGVSNHQPHHCLLSRLFWRRSKKHQSSASLAFVRGIHRGPVNSPHKGPVTRKMLPFDDVIMYGKYGHGFKKFNSIGTISQPYSNQLKNIPLMIAVLFYPLAFQDEGLLSLPVSVRLSTRPLFLVRTITHHKFELESPNLHQTCILGYSRLVLKMEVIGPDLQCHFDHFDSEF